MKVLVKSKYDKKLHYKFSMFHLFGKSASIYFFLAASILSVYLAVVTTYNPESTPTSKATAWAFVVFILTAIPFFTFGKIKGIIRKNEKERQDNLEVLEFSKAKIVRFIEGREGKVVLGWDVFESIYEFEDYFLMYIDRDRGLVVAKADIVEGDVDTLVKLMKNNMKPNKKGKINYKKMFKEVKND